MMKNFQSKLLALLLVLGIGGWGAVIFLPQQAISQFVDQGTFGGTSTGSANAQVISVGNYNAPVVGVRISFRPGFTNTGPMTLNISGTGALPVVRPTSIGGAQLSGSEILFDELTCVTYTGSVYQLSCNVDLTPVGRTVEYRGFAVPRGTLVEDGSCVSQTTYPALFAVISTNYGSCSAGLFALPDSRGTVFGAQDNQGVNGAANRITNAGSGCNATLSVVLCGVQNATLNLGQLPTGITGTNNTFGIAVANPGTINFSATSTGAGGTTPTTWVNNGGNPTASFTPGGGGAGTYMTGTASFVGPVNVVGAIAVGGISSTGSVTNGTFTVTSNNTLGQAHSVLNPMLVGRRAIKY